MSININTITLDCNMKENVWTATFEGPHAAEVVRVFGTACIPTAFSASARAATVLTAISELNPGCRIHCGAYAHCLEV